MAMRLSSRTNAQRLRQEPPWTWYELDDRNWTLIPFDDHLGALFDAFQDTGNIADCFH